MVLVSLYLVLTWALLLTSIDAVNFEAHELTGRPSSLLQEQECSPTRAGKTTPPNLRFWAVPSPFPCWG